MNAERAARGQVLLLLESGAGGFLGAEGPAAIRARPASLGSPGWLFRCGTTRRGGSSARVRRVVGLRLLEVIGTPRPDSLAAALRIAGQRHSTTYRLLDA